MDPTTYTFTHADFDRVVAEAQRALDEAEYPYLSKEASQRFQGLIEKVEGLAKKCIEMLANPSATSSDLNKQTTSITNAMQKDLADELALAKHNNAPYHNQKDSEKASKLIEQVLTAVQSNKTIIQAGFASIANPDNRPKQKQQLSSLKKLILEFEGLKEKPTSVILRYCDILEFTRLKAVLYEGLEVLDISGNSQIKDKHIEIISSSCPNLTELYLNACTKLTCLSSLEKKKTTLLKFSSLKRLQANHCPALTTLKLSVFALEDLEVTHNPKLKSLVCENLTCLKVDCSDSPKAKLDYTHAYARFSTDRGYIYLLGLTAPFPLVKKFPSLKDEKHVTIYNIGKDDNGCLSWFIQNCRSLTKLGFVQCNGMTNTGVSYLKPLFSVLEELNFGEKNDSITDEGLAPLKKFHVLTKLVVTGCGKITSEGLEHFKSPSLTIL